MPTDGVAIGLSTIALINSQQAKAAVDAVRRAQCKLEMTAFQATTATVEQQHSYADCVNLLYHDNVAMPHAAIIGAKIAILAVLLGGVVGGYIEAEDEGPIAGFFLGMGITVIGIVGLGVVAMILAFLIAA